MARPYSMDLRGRAMARLAAGETCREVAAALRIAVSSVVKWSARNRLFGSAAPDRMGGRRPMAIGGAHRLFVLDAIKTTPHMTLHALSEALAARGLVVHPATVGRFLARERKSYKKNRSAGRTGPSRRGAAARALDSLSSQAD
jgi:putative transposase